MFRSNPEMIRHYFDELLSDGEAHSTKEIKAYIFEATGGKGVSGQALTEPMIASTIHAMMRTQSPDLQQPRRGYYQRQQIAEELTAVKFLLQRARSVLMDAKDRMLQVYSVDLTMPYFFESLPQLQEHGRHLTASLQEAIEYTDRELGQLSVVGNRQEDSEEIEEEDCVETGGMQL